VVDAGTVNGWHRDVVDVLDQQPPAGRDCPPPIPHLETLRQVKKDESFMDEIPRSVRDGLAHDVVTTDRQLGLTLAHHPLGNLLRTSIEVHEDFGAVPFLAASQAPAPPT